MFLAFAEVKAQSNEVVSANADIITEEFPQAKAEIKNVLDAIFKSIQDKDADKLISYHVYGPKFTEFRDGDRRTGSEGNEAYERGLVDAISGFEYELEDLLINVFGEVAVVTFHANFRPTINEEEHHSTGQVTLVFINTDDSWKITHEHFSPLNPEIGD